MEEACYDRNHSTQDSFHEDEVIDTLSLSDLLIYDNNDDSQDYQVDYQNPNLETDDQFEFSSEILSTPENNSVVFCGKIIPYKEPSGSQKAHKLESKKQQKRRKRRWRFVQFFKKSSNSKSNLDSEKLDLKYDVPIRRVSILASATKPRWYLFMFGFGSSRFPAEVHIRDLKKRQTSIVTNVGGNNKVSGGSAGGGGGMGSWWLVRLLGCGGGSHGGGDEYHPNAIVKIE